MYVFLIAFLMSLSLTFHSFDHLNDPTLLEIAENLLLFAVSGLEVWLVKFVGFVNYFVYSLKN